MKVAKKNLDRSANQIEKHQDKTLDKKLSNSNITQSIVKSQDDFSEFQEFQSKFIPKKAKTETLANSLYRIGEIKRSYRVRDCGTLLTFAHEIDSFGEISSKGKLHNANFCRERLCPMCIWRRTLKIYGQVSQIMGYMPKDVSYLFLTLTVPNCSGEDFQKTLDRLFKAWKKLHDTKKFKSAILGYYRVLEVTRNKKKNTYHPHFHVILVVSKSYFKGNLYISHDKWLEMWRKAYGDDTITQVDIRKIKARDKSLSETSDLSDLDGFKSLEGAVSETAKYAVKDEDFIISDNETMDSVIQVLLYGLKGRRLVQFGGLFKEIADSLKLDDVEDGDLIHIDDDKINNALAHMIVRYGWRSGVYQILSKEIKKVGDIE